MINTRYIKEFLWDYLSIILLILGRSMVAISYYFVDSVFVYPILIVAALFFLSSMIIMFYKFSPIRKLESIISLVFVFTLILPGLHLFFEHVYDSSNLIQTTVLFTFLIVILLGTSMFLSIKLATIINIRYNVIEYLS